MISSSNGELFPRIREVPSADPRYGGKSTPQTGECGGVHLRIIEWDRVISMYLSCYGGGQKRITVSRSLNGIL